MTMNEITIRHMGLTILTILFGALVWLNLHLIIIQGARNADYEAEAKSLEAQSAILVTSIEQERVK